MYGFKSAVASGEAAQQGHGRRVDFFLFLCAYVCFCLEAHVIDIGLIFIVLVVVVLFCFFLFPHNVLDFSLTLSLLFHLSTLASLGFRLVCRFALSLAASGLFVAWT